jgi:hypothetical protein
MPKAITPVADRFKQSLGPADARGCIPFMGHRTKLGYGRIKTDSRKGRPIYAHRLSWELAHGPIPAGTCVLHKCDNPACVNVDHLFLGDRAENMRDMNNKGRRGRCGAKLNVEQVREIRILGATGQNRRNIARRFGVSTQNVFTILARRSWAQV